MIHPIPKSFKGLSSVSSTRALLARLPSPDGANRIGVSVAIPKTYEDRLTSHLVALTDICSPPKGSMLFLEPKLSSCSLAMVSGSTDL
jgi:hypothetical protein